MSGRLNLNIEIIGLGTKRTINFVETGAMELMRNGNSGSLPHGNKNDIGVASYRISCSTESGRTHLSPHHRRTSTFGSWQSFHADKLTRDAILIIYSLFRVKLLPAMLQVVGEYR